MTNMRYISKTDVESVAKARVVVSVSGGKDSTAASLALQEHGVSHERVFFDTGWEHADTYEYLRGPLRDAIGEITWVQSKNGGMVDHILRKQMFPSRVRRWCTDELKVRPARDFFRDVVAEEMASSSPRFVVNVTGIRADESASRGRLPEWERWGADGRGDLPVIVWRPLLQWSERDVIDIHRRHSIRPNPLYLRGARRVGCWPCIHARKSEIAMISAEDPSRIGLIRSLETMLSEASRVKATVRSTQPFPEHIDEDDANIEAELRDPDHWRNTKTFFAIGEKFRGEVPWIDRVVEWARTDRGGRQFMLFDDPSSGARDGCMRWGMCETGGTKDEEP